MQAVIRRGSARVAVAVVGSTLPLQCGTQSLLVAQRLPLQSLRFCATTTTPPPNADSAEVSESKQPAEETEKPEVVMSAEQAETDTTAASPPAEETAANKNEGKAGGKKTRRTKRGTAMSPGRRAALEFERMHAKERIEGVMDNWVNSPKTGGGCGYIYSNGRQFKVLATSRPRKRGFGVTMAKHAIPSGHYVSFIPKEALSPGEPPLAVGVVVIGPAPKQDGVNVTPTWGRVWRVYRRGRSGIIIGMDYRKYHFKFEEIASPRHGVIKPGHLVRFVPQPPRGANSAYLTATNMSVRMDRKPKLVRATRSLRCVVDHWTSIYAVLRLPNGGVAPATVYDFVGKKEAYPPGTPVQATLKPNSYSKRLEAIKVWHRTAADQQRPVRINQNPKHTSDQWRHSKATQQGVSSPVIRERKVGKIEAYFAKNGTGRIRQLSPPNDIFLFQRDYVVDQNNRHIRDQNIKGLNNGSIVSFEPGPARNMPTGEVRQTARFVRIEKAEEAQPGRMEGILDFWNERARFGFITGYNGQQFYFNAKHLPRSMKGRNPTLGYRCSFQPTKAVAEYAGKKQSVALRVEILGPRDGAPPVSVQATQSAKQHATVSGPDATGFVKRTPGIVKKWFPQTRTGFITDNGGTEYFFSGSHLRRDGFNAEQNIEALVAPGVDVTFEPRQSPRTGQVHATFIKISEKQTAPREAELGVVNYWNAERGVGTIHAQRDRAKCVLTRSGVDNSGDVAALARGVVVQFTRASVIAQGRMSPDAFDVKVLPAEKAKEVVQKYPFLKRSMRFATGPSKQQKEGEEPKDEAK